MNFWISSMRIAAFDQLRNGIADVAVAVMS